MLLVCEHRQFFVLFPGSPNIHIKMSIIYSLYYVAIETFQRIASSRNTTI